MSIAQLFRSRDWRRVRGADGQLALWPDEFVEEGWQRREEIQAFRWAFCSEPPREVEAT